MKKARPRLGGEAGFGLLAILIASAVGMVAVAGIAESVLLMVRSQQSMEITRDSQLLLDQIEMVLSNEQMCKAVLGNGSPVLNPVLGSVTTFPLNPPPPVDLGTLTGISLTSGSSLTPSIKLVKFELQDPGLAKTVFTPINAALPVNKYVMNLVMQTQKVTTGLFPPLSAPRTTKIDVILDATNRIAGCSIQSDLSSACENAGGIWDPSATVGNMCVPYKYCDWGGSFTAHSGGSDPGFDNPFTGSQSCPTGYTQQQSGAIASAQRAGKHGITNNLQPIYSCMRCGAGTAVPNPPAITSIDLGMDQALQDLEDTQTMNYNDATTIRNAICATNPSQCASIPLPQRYPQ